MNFATNKNRPHRLFLYLSSSFGRHDGSIWDYLIYTRSLLLWTLSNISSQCNSVSDCWARGNSCVSKKSNCKNQNVTRNSYELRSFY